MSLLAPFALWGLLALALPVALHLRRRRVGRTVQVGSVRHLESLPTAERRGLRLREPWLLLLRSAIIALLVLLLAGPMLDRPMRQGRAVVLVDSAASSALIDSLGQGAALFVERIDEPWRRVAELDDSLPESLPLIVVASNDGARYTGPRPTVARAITWIPIDVTRRVRLPASRDPSLALRAGPRPASPVTPMQARALAAAVAAVAEEFGPLRDTTGWQASLPEWWRDSLMSPSFPIAVARVLAPERVGPPNVTLTTAQLLPRVVTTRHGQQGSTDLHWWFWALAVALFAGERLWALQRRGRA